MSFALSELRRILHEPEELLGVVVAVDQGVFRIATERGAITARSLDNLQPGNRVVVRHGMASRRPAARVTVPV